MRVNAAGEDNVMFAGWRNIIAHMQRNRSTSATAPSWAGANHVQKAPGWKLEKFCSNKGPYYGWSNMHGVNSVHTDQDCIIPEEKFVAGDIYSTASVTLRPKNLVTGSVLARDTVIERHCLIAGGVSVRNTAHIEHGALIGAPYRVAPHKAPLPLWCTVAVLAGGDITIDSGAVIFGSVISLSGEVHVKDGARIFGCVYDSKQGLPHDGLDVEEAKKMPGIVAAYSPIGVSPAGKEPMFANTWLGQGYAIPKSRRKEWRKDSALWYGAWDDNLRRIPLGNYQREHVSPLGCSCVDGSRDKMEPNSKVYPYFASDVETWLKSWLMGGAPGLWENSFILGDVVVPRRKTLIIPKDSFVDGTITLKPGAHLYLRDGAQVSGGIITTSRNHITIGRECVVYNGIMGDGKTMTLDSVGDLKTPTLHTLEAGITKDLADSVWGWGARHVERMKRTCRFSDEFMVLHGRYHIDMYVLFVGQYV